MEEFSEIALRRLDLNLLLVFSALMRERSVNRAAGRLLIGSSAVSMALGRLRDAVGDELFVRGAGGMEPTPQALLLWSTISPALASIEDAVSEMRRFEPASSNRVFRFVVPDDLEFVLVPMLLQRLADQAPNVRLVVRPSDFRGPFGRLDENDADLALLNRPVGQVEGRHTVSALFTDSYSVLFDRKMVNVRSPISLDDYLAVPHLLLSTTGELRDSIDQALARMDRSRQVIAAVSHYPTMPFILKHRRALANVPAVAARYIAKTYRLEASEPPLPFSAFDVCLAWHARTNSDQANVWFRKLVTKVVLEIAR